MFALQAYYREGAALQCLNREAEALAAYASGLAEDPKNAQLLATFTQAAAQSSLKGEFGTHLRHNIPFLGRK
jgi:hypothetical protein